MPQVKLANTQCSILAELCDAEQSRDTYSKDIKFELRGIADMLRKANGTYQQPPDGPPLTGVSR